MNKLLTSVAAVSTIFLVSSCAQSGSQTPPIFPNSVVSNDLDFITKEDAHAFACLIFSGRESREMPGNPSDEILVDRTFIFTAQFKDRADLEIWAHPDFDTVENAQKHVEMIVEPLGRLPSFMRQRLAHVVLHEGDEAAFGEDKGHFFVLYSENVKKRIRSHDIEETIFHESVHATLDNDYLKSADWIEAQKSDAAYITRYAAEQPDKEDMAESALFAYTILYHPGRLPGGVERQVKTLMPNRLAYFSALFEKLANTVTDVDQSLACPS